MRKGSTCFNSSPRDYRTPEIVGRLVLSTATVKTHLSRLLMKLSARDRAQLVAIAYQTGFVRSQGG